MKARQSSARFLFLLLTWLVSFNAAADVAQDIEFPNDPSARITLPKGFHLHVFAKLSASPGDDRHGVRMMAFGPDGNLYVSVASSNEVLMLRDKDEDGVVDEVVKVAEGLNAPNGLAFVNGKLLVAEQDGIVVLKQDNGHWPAKEKTALVSGLAIGHHTLKTVKLGPDGYLYINVGSSCNVCVEGDPTRATLLRFTQEGMPAGAIPTVGRHAGNPIWATGLRNTQGFAWHPKTNEMFATNDGSDMRSDKKGGAVNEEVPPENLNKIEPGNHYGWPYCWGNQFADPNFVGPDGFCATTSPPEVMFDSHSTPIGMTFLNAANVPSDYKDDAIVALHGSWNRKNPSGYKIVRVKFKDNKPVEVVDFATGWLQGHAAWGRPVDVAVGPDGDVYVSDDRSGVIYAIHYDGK